jgi:hypothetical protein
MAVAQPASPIGIPVETLPSSDKGVVPPPSSKLKLQDASPPPPPPLPELPPELDMSLNPGELLVLPQDAMETPTMRKAATLARRPRLVVLRK